MSLDQTKLADLIREDYQAHEERLRVWIEAAEEALKAPEYPKQVYELLFLAQVEFHRRRVYLSLNMPELERRGSAALRAMEAASADPDKPKSLPRFKNSFLPPDCVPPENPL